MLCAFLMGKGVWCVGSALWWYKPLPLLVYMPQEFSSGQSDPALVITEAPMEEQGLSKLQIQVSERLHAGKKRARKLKQKMGSW